MELVSEALEALTYFLEDAIAIPGPKSRDIIGADGTVSISSYAGGGPSSETSQIIYQYSLAPSVALSVIGSGGNVGSINAPCSPI